MTNLFLFYLCVGMTWMGAYAALEQVGARRWRREIKAIQIDAVEVRLIRLEAELLPDALKARARRRAILTGGRPHQQEHRKSKSAEEVPHDLMMRVGADV